jgi:hypothetical protein
VGGNVKYGGYVEDLRVKIEMKRGLLELAECPENVVVVVEDYDIMGESETYELNHPRKGDIPTGVNNNTDADKNQPRSPAFKMISGLQKARKGVEDSLNLLWSPTGECEQKAREIRDNLDVIPPKLVDIELKLSESAMSSKQSQLVAFILKKTLWDAVEYSKGSYTTTEDLIISFSEKEKSLLMDAIGKLERNNG